MIGVAHETIERGLRHDLRVDVLARLSAQLAKPVTRVTPYLLDMLHDRPFDQCGVLSIVDPAASQGTAGQAHSPSLQIPNPPAHSTS